MAKLTSRGGRGRPRNAITNIALGFVETVRGGPIAPERGDWPTVTVDVGKLADRDSESLDVDAPDGAMFCVIVGKDTADAMRQANSLAESVARLTDGRAGYSIMLRPFVFDPTADSIGAYLKTQNLRGGTAKATAAVDAAVGDGTLRGDAAVAVMFYRPAESEGTAEPPKTRTRSGKRNA